MSSVFVGPGAPQREHFTKTFKLICSDRCFTAVQNVLENKILFPEIQALVRLSRKCLLILSRIFNEIFHVAPPKSKEISFLGLRKFEREHFAKEGDRFSLKRSEFRRPSNY